MKSLFSFFLSLLCTAALFSQAGPLSPADNSNLQKAESDLLQLSYIMHTDSSDEARFLACKSLIKDLVEALKTPNSFNFDFSGLEGVKVMMAPDSSFRFFTWELHVNRDEYRHYGAIQYNSSALKLMPLIDRGDQLRQNPETAITSNTDWLGYVIYNIIPGGTYQGKPYYFLFGYNRHAALSRQKVLDVFYLDPAGKPVFGLPVFAVYTPEGHLLEDHTRLVLEYSAEANVAMRFEPESKRIIYENLIIAQGPDGGPISLPDGSYHALEYGTDGRWHEISKVFNHKYEKAPVERVLPEEKKDIMGRPKGRL
ncbi:hypothetical protein FUA23_08900 [Neolewinella aurantiaca]|uniref:Uncharacterized protein n=1 Tax=Neolewinella aurantiaca TaxID=2602767 RepID=A0A5C7FF46_9BACT|nr:hypothetical protein [Neolewinella aurantiaca]TXF89794.1 hypothetical protein FUA23_08900 [Neolewinella aurantiaca]